MKKKVLILSFSAIIAGLIMHTTKSMLSSNVSSKGSTGTVSATDIENQLKDLEQKTDQLGIDLNAGATSFANNITLKIKELNEDAQDVFSKTKSIAKKINTSTDALEAKKLGLNLLSNLAINESNIAASLAEIVELTQFLAKGDLHTNKTVGEDIYKKTDPAIDMLAKLEKISNKLKTSLNTLSASSIFTAGASRVLFERSAIGLVSSPKEKSSVLGNLSSGAKTGVSAIGTGLKTGWEAIGGSELLRSGVTAAIQGGFGFITAWYNNKAAEREYQAKQLANAQEKEAYEQEQTILRELIGRVNAEQSRYNTIAGLINRPITTFNDQLSKPLRNLKNDTQDVIDSIAKINTDANNDNVSELSRVNISLKYFVAMGENNAFLMDVAEKIIYAIDTFTGTIFSKEDDAQLQLASASKNAKAIFTEFKEFFDELPGLQAKIKKIEEEEVLRKEEAKKLDAAKKLEEAKKLEIAKEKEKTTTTTPKPTTTPTTTWAW